MTATKSNTRSKTTGRKKTASKAAGRKKKTTAKKTAGRKTTGKKSAKKTASRKAGARKASRKSNGAVATMLEPTDLVTMQEPEELVDMMQVPEFPAPDAALDKVFSNGMKTKAKSSSRKRVEDEFAAWSMDPDKNPKHVGMAIRGHVSQPFKVARERLARMPVAVTLTACLLGGFAFGWIARGL